MVKVLKSEKGMWTDVENGSSNLLSELKCRTWAVSRVQAVYQVSV